MIFHDLPQIVTFSLGGELYAADVTTVERVLLYTEPSPVPGVPEWMRGVIDYGRRMVPVLDLRARLELAPEPASASTRIIIFVADGQWVGAIVDAVLDVRGVDPSTLEPPPPLVRGLAAEFLRGLTRRGDRVVVVIEAARLLAATDHAIITHALAAATGAGVSSGE